MKDIVPEAFCPRGSINYLKELRDLARTNRRSQTKAESKLWEEVLRNKQTGFIFLRQKPIGRFILDFYCSRLCLDIEVDGDSHDHKKGYDRTRDQFLRQMGIATVRFTNKEVLGNLDYVKSVLQLSLVKGRFRGIKI